MEKRHRAYLRELATALEYPNEVSQIGTAICRRAFDQDLHRQYSAEAAIVSSLYAAARHVGVSFEFETISDTTQIDRETLDRTYSQLKDVFGSELDLESPHPHKLVGQYCTELDVDEDVKTTAQEIVDRFTEAELHAGCHSSGVAAGAVYLAALETEGDGLIQAEVAEVSDTTPLTVRHRYQEQKEVLGLDISTGGGRPSARRRWYRSLSASELDEQLENFDVLEKAPGTVSDARVQCVHCGTTGEYGDLRGFHKHCGR